MSSGEVNALNELAKAHGGHLTINPKTGLPEAGFLSGLLPTIVGVGLGAMTGVDPMLIAGGVGLADYALTGSLGQGLMAGLGAWSGAGLAGDIKAIAPEVQQGTNVAEEASNAAADRALNQTFNPISSLSGQTTDLTSAFANQSPTAGALDTTTTGLNAAPPPPSIPTNVNANIPQVNTNFTPQQVPGSFPQGTATPSYAGPQALSNADKFQYGFNQITSSPQAALDFAKANKMDVIGTAMPFVSAGLQALRPDPYVPPAQQKNPFNLKTISPDFKGTFPEQPNPPYQAQYRNYVTNPYTTYAARGGLQNVNKYSGESDSLTAIGKSLLKQHKYQEAPIGLGDPNAKYDPAYYEGDSGISANKWGRDYDTMSADQLATHILTSAKSLGKAATKSSVMAQDPAQTSLASIQSETPSSSAKEGGLQGYALGGLSLGNLGGYSDGGRLLKGPGDGVSDSIPASIGNKQPARLAEGEFVIPARIVSELGNGSTDAGAKRLYAMMDRIKAKRAKSKNIAADTKTYNLLPA
jgi:hypothetical protein